MRNDFWKFWTLIMLFLIILIMGNTKSLSAQAKFSELNRENAAALIRKAGLDPVIFEVPIGPNLNIDAYIEVRGKLADNIYGCLRKLGYLNFVPKKVLGGSATWYDVSVTDKGKTIGKPVGRPQGNYKFVYIFKVCDRVLNAVTGIKKTGDASAIVEFQWQQGNCNEVFSCIFQPETIVHPAQAIFGRYDDGWRVENIQLNPVRRQRSRSR